MFRTACETASIRFTITLMKLVHRRFASCPRVSRLGLESFSDTESLFQRMKTEWSNQITGPNVGGRRQLAMRTRWAARVGQFWRWAREVVAHESHESHEGQRDVARAGTLDGPHTCDSWAHSPAFIVHRFGSVFVSQHRMTHLIALRARCRDIAGRPWPNQAAAVNAPVASRFQVGHPGRRVTEQQRSTASA